MTRTVAHYCAVKLHVILPCSAPGPQQLSSYREPGLVRCIGYFYSQDRKREDQITAEFGTHPSTKSRFKRSKEEIQGVKSSLLLMHQYCTFPLVYTTTHFNSLIVLFIRYSKTYLMCHVLPM